MMGKLIQPAKIGITERWKATSISLWQRVLPLFLLVWFSYHVTLHLSWKKAVNIILYVIIIQIHPKIQLSHLYIR